MDRFNQTLNDTFSLGLVTPVMNLGEISTTSSPYIFMNYLTNLYRPQYKIANLKVDYLKSRLA